MLSEDSLDEEHPVSVASDVPAKNAVPADMSKDCLMNSDRLMVMVVWLSSYNIIG